MNARERFNRIMNYQAVDRLPVIRVEPYEDSGLARWHTEGLPENQFPDTYLGMDLMHNVGLNLSPMPAYEEKLIAEDEESYTQIDYLGCTVRRLKVSPTMYYGYVDHPVKSPEDWEEYKKRFDKNLPGRLLQNSEKKILELNAAESPVGIVIYPFFFRLGFFSLGMERFMTAFYDMPDLMHDMFAFWSDLVLHAIRPYLGKLKIDYVSFAEDLAYKGGPHLSPSIYKEFFLPYQDPIIKELKKHGVSLFSMYTAGNIKPILPLLMEHGFNCTWPLERGSFMDPVELRQMYGKDLRLIGGIAKETLIAGPDAIDREIERLMTLMVEGGYIPAVDDMITPEVPFDTYRYYVDAIKAIKF